jgi:hypothetical protein
MAFFKRARMRKLSLNPGSILLVCLLALCLVAVHSDQLGALGFAYSLSESLIVLGLVWEERRLLGTLSQSPL